MWFLIVTFITANGDAGLLQFPTTSIATCAALAEDMDKKAFPTPDAAYECRNAEETSPS